MSSDVHAVLCPDCASDTLDPEPGERDQFCESCWGTYRLNECVLVDRDGFRIVR